MRSITICVEFADILAITLPRNAKHFESMTVVTHPGDGETIEVVKSVGNARLVTTDVFWKDGAHFNKWAAMEIGLESMGRHGDMCIIDADILLPDSLGGFEITPGYLACPNRRMLYNPFAWSEDLDWSQVPIKPECEYAGYCQLFNAEDPCLERRPWFDSHWNNASIGDSLFQDRWAPMRKTRPGFTVLHIGPDGVNWCGRSTIRLDGSFPALAVERLVLMRKLMRDRVILGGYQHERIATADIQSGKN